MPYEFSVYSRHDMSFNLPLQTRNFAQSIFNRCAFCSLATQTIKSISNAAWKPKLEEHKSLTHLDERGNVNFVNIGSKKAVKRRAVSESEVLLSNEVFKLVKDNSVKKGDFESTVKLAGVMGAKMTSQLIPLCHNIQLDHVEVHLIYEEPNKLK